METLKDVLEKVQMISIFGKIGSGKTALAFKLLEWLADKKPIYVIKHPQPKLIEEFGYINIESINDIEKLSDCVVYFDEPQLALDVADYKRDRIMARVCSLARQRDIKLIISTSDSRLLSPRVEAYIGLWLIKDCEFALTKQRSMLRHIIIKNSLVSPDGFKLKDNEFVADTREHYTINGTHTFTLPDNWSDELSKAYKHGNIRDTSSEKNHGENSPKTHGSQLNNSLKNVEITNQRVESK